MLSARGFAYLAASSISELIATSRISSSVSQQLFSAAGVCEFPTVYWVAHKLPSSYLLLSTDSGLAPLVRTMTSSSSAQLMPIERYIQLRDLRTSQPNEYYR